MATRPITAATAAAAGGKQKGIIAFCDFDFSSGFVRVCNASYPITWNGQTWQGMASLGQISEMRETLNMEAVGLNFTLSGIDPAKVNAALTEFYQGRIARMWLGYFDSGAIVVDPVLLVRGRMDTMGIQDGETCRIALSVENRLAQWSKPRTRRFSDADQQLEYSGDLGLMYINEFASGKEIIWGRA